MLSFESLINHSISPKDDLVIEFLSVSDQDNQGPNWSTDDPQEKHR